MESTPTGKEEFLKRLEFTEVTEPNSERERRRELLRAHPDVKLLMGRNPWSAACILAIVAAQLAIASALSLNNVHWAIVLGFAYLAGAAMNHALYVLIHEATHNLIGRKESTNRVLGIVCDFALFFPAAMSFRKYHLQHHQFGGVKDLDPDFASDWEARIVRNISWRKALFLFFFMISLACRPLNVVGPPLWDKWVTANILVVIAVNVSIFHFAGVYALLYLGLSTFFGLGLHPLGGRSLQEHYTTAEGQETYSYYGPLNRLAFNVGYHNEHHDLVNVPWSNLPKLKSKAPEFYEPLKSYRSWTGVVVDFIRNPDLSCYSRIVRNVSGERTRNSPRKTSPDGKKGPKGDTDFQPSV